MTVCTLKIISYCFSCNIVNTVDDRPRKRARKGAAPDEVLAAVQELGLPGLGVPESLGGIMEERSATAGALVAEAPEDRPGSCGWPTTRAPSDRA